MRSIKAEYPEDAPKQPLTELDRHAQFIEVYLKKDDISYVRSNGASIWPDIKRIEAALGLDGRSEIRADVDKLKPGKERDLLNEAVRCLEAEAPRGAVVLAVSALESQLRALMEGRTGKSTSSTSFYEVIEQVASQQKLTNSEKALLDLSRPFRNLAAHPTEYTFTAGDATGIIHLVAEQIRKRQ